MKSCITFLVALMFIALQLNAQGSNETPQGKFEPNVINVTAMVGDTVVSYFDVINTGSVRFSTTSAFSSEYGFFMVETSQLNDYIYPGESRRVTVTYTPTLPGVHHAYYQSNIGGGTFLKVNMTGTAIQKGDVNQDGSVDISDVVELIDQILNFNDHAASSSDINQDGSLSITDLVMLIDYMLSGYWANETPDPNVFEDEEFEIYGCVFKMIAVEGGTFMMGEDNGFDTDLPHQVTVSDYHIAETEVTQDLWDLVMGYNPSAGNGGQAAPVENVSWNDCQEFVSRLNQITGRNFRLPTEAEWEFAALGGNKSHGYIYSGSNNINDVGWSEDNSGDRTHVVGSKQPNELGIYDMSGNVWEWCQDWYGPYSVEPQTDPVGPDSGDGRVARGGCMWGHTRLCTVKYRWWCEPEFKRGDIGLRIAL